MNSKTSSNNAYSNVLASIPCSSVQNGLIYYVNYTNYKSICKNSHLDKLNRKLYDMDVSKTGLYRFIQ